MKREVTRYSLRASQAANRKPFVRGAPHLRVNTGAEGEIRGQEQHTANCLTGASTSAGLAGGGGAGVRARRMLLLELVG